MFGPSRVTLLLLSCLFLSSCSSYGLGRKYIPPQNPGGEYFSTDIDFMRAYKYYDKNRTSAYVDDEYGEDGDSDVDEAVALGSLKNYGVVSGDVSNDRENTVVRRSNTPMMNKDGIDLSAVSGAVFVDAGSRGVQSADGGTSAIKGGSEDSEKLGSRGGETSNDKEAGSKKLDSLSVVGIKSDVSDDEVASDGNGVTGDSDTGGEVVECTELMRFMGAACDSTEPLDG